MNIYIVFEMFIFCNLSKRNITVTSNVRLYKYYRVLTRVYYAHFYEYFPN